MRPRPTARMAWRCFNLHMGVMRRLCDYCSNGRSMHPEPTVRMGGHLLKLHEGARGNRAAIARMGGACAPSRLPGLRRIT